MAKIWQKIFRDNVMRQGDPALLNLPLQCHTQTEGRQT
ncbi:hypothetical protein CES86_3271 [Brucella lupini]|uniref:Uncharacterized protein n=1 Tax=Brucella lupini TaxID=255457 RepID=A0A256GIS2_9HYPH|nr:hypothetical protein CES86_3271 [Brucella lupini]